MITVEDLLQEYCHPDAFVHVPGHLEPSRSINRCLTR